MGRTRTNSDNVRYRCRQSHLMIAVITPGDHGAIVAQSQCMVGAGRQGHDVRKAGGHINLAEGIIAPGSHRTGLGLNTDRTGNGKKTTTNEAPKTRGRGAVRLLTVENGAQEILKISVIRHAILR